MMKFSAVSTFVVTRVGGSCIGDRMTLEIKYMQNYTDLPLTRAEAENRGYIVDPECRPGLGHRATIHDMLHLWYDQNGDAMGFGGSAISGVEEPWHQEGDEWVLDFIFRDPDAACGDGPAAVAGCLGDRFLMVTDGQHTEMPVTLDDALAARTPEGKKYLDGGPCVPDMGWHMGYDAFKVSAPASVFGGDGKLLAMNLNTYTTQPSVEPSWEYPQPKEGSELYAQHVYFRENHGTCEAGNLPTLWPTTPGKVPATDPHKRKFHTTCQPYFGWMWAMTLTTVYDPDTHFIHFMGPTIEDGLATACTPPVINDGCHRYVQTVYGGEKCEDAIVTSNLTGTQDVDGLFDADGVFRACNLNSDDGFPVASSTVCFSSGPDGDLQECDCAGPAVSI